MRFGTDRPIFAQIAEFIEDQILRGELKPEQRIPAVRDYAVQLEVNPNTVVRSAAELEAAGVIFKRRGLGYFVGPDALQRIKDSRRRHLVEHQLPAVARQMRQLAVSLAEFETIYRNAPGDSLDEAK
jgi:DNA-binding transcriptional regulator YhcF (GntR family)